MAQKKAPRKKLSIKPEEVLIARKKTAISKPQPAPKKAIKKPKKKRIALRKYGKIRIRQSVFFSIVSIILAIAVVITWMQVQASVRDTTASLDASVKTANSTYVIAKKEADLIKIIGTKLQRQSEIKNYQSAPTDLQKFVTADYKQFKQQCIANGKLSDDVSYEVGSVIYDSFAVVKRTCNGTDTAILKKFGEKWAIAFSGNVLPPCSVTNDLNIPQGASYYCEQNGVTYINPNP